MQHHAANKLHVKVAHAHNAFAGLTDNRKGFGQQGVERLAARQTGPELGRFGLQRHIIQCFHCRLERIDAFHLLAIGFKEPIITASEQVFEQASNHEVIPVKSLEILACWRPFICVRTCSKRPLRAAAD